MVPPGATTYRAGMVNVQLGSTVEGREIGPAALLDGAQFVAGLPPQAESVRDLASRIARLANESPLRLCVSRRCQTSVRDDEQRGRILHRRAK
jgi:hypothetical protein